MFTEVLVLKPQAGVTVNRKRRKPVGYMEMMDSYSTIKRNKLLTHTLIRVNLTNTLN